MDEDSESNPLNFYPFSVDLDKNDAFYQDKVKILELLGENYEFHLTSDVEDEDIDYLLSWCRFITYNEGNPKELKYQIVK